MLQARQRVNQRGRGPRPRLGQAERHAVDRVGRPLSERPSRHAGLPSRTRNLLKFEMLSRSFHFSFDTFFVWTIGVDYLPVQLSRIEAST